MTSSHYLTVNCDQFIFPSDLINYIDQISKNDLNTNTDRAMKDESHGDNNIENNNDATLASPSRVSVIPWFFRDLLSPYKTRICHYFQINKHELRKVLKNDVIPESSFPSRGQTLKLFSVVGILRAVLSECPPSEMFLNFARFDDIISRINVYDDKGGVVHNNIHVNKTISAFSIHPRYSDLFVINLNTLYLICGKPPSLFSQLRNIRSDFQNATGSSNFTIYKYGQLAIAASAFYIQVSNPMSGRPLPEILSNLLRSLFVGGKRLMRESLRNGIEFRRLLHSLESHTTALYVSQPLLKRVVAIYEKSRDPFINKLINVMNGSIYDSIKNFALASFINNSTIDATHFFVNFKPVEDLESIEKIYNNLLSSRTSKIGYRRGRNVIDKTRGMVKTSVKSLDHPETASDISTFSQSHKSSEILNHQLHESGSTSPPSSVSMEDMAESSMSVIPDSGDISNDVHRLKEKEDTDDKRKSNIEVKTQRAMQYDPLANEVRTSVQKFKAGTSTTSTMSSTSVIQQNLEAANILLNKFGVA